MFLLPLFMGCVLFFLVIWMIIRNKRNETNKRVEVALAAIEKNPGIDVEELLKKVKELEVQLSRERLRADFYEEMVAYGKEVYGIDLKKAGTK